MARGPQIRFAPRGVDTLLKGVAMQRAMRLKAEQVAIKLRAMGIRVGDQDGGARERDLPVSVDSQVTDRARSTVTITHPAGLAVQAKHGALTKAAAQAGLEVKDKTR